MARGGPRNRSGPQRDPKSATSERKGVKFTALPASGYDGPMPGWPLPTRAVYYFDEDKKRQLDQAATEAVMDRERELWEWAWRTPQAWAWSQPSESWRTMTVAMWVRTFVLCESSDATAADKGSLHRFADQIGMTPAGLRENGWAIATDEVGARRAEKAEEPAKAEPARRPRVATGGSA